jgi:hypothetical protein
VTRNSFTIQIYVKEQEREGLTGFRIIFVIVIIDIKDLRACVLVKIGTWYPGTRQRQVQVRCRCNYFVRKKGRITAAIINHLVITIK